MRMKVGGCYGSETGGYHSVGFLLNENLLLEGGTVTSVFSLEEQKSIRNILISHIHLDHTKELFFLLDNLAPMECCTVTVNAVPEVIKGIRENLFNEMLWPDFSRLPDVDAPVLRFNVLEEGCFTEVEGVQVKPVTVNHPVPATGFVLKEPGTTIVYTGDTGPTEAIWEAAREEEELGALLVETSFPNSMNDLALKSGHLTPDLLVKELDLLDRPDVPVFLFHMKPHYLGEIAEDLKKISRYRVAMLEQEGHMISRLGMPFPSFGAGI